MKRPTLKQLRSTINKHTRWLARRVITPNTDRAIFLHQDLSWRSFKGCNLAFAVFYDCDLTGVDFHEANLQNTVFFRCDVAEVDFTTSRYIETLIEDCSA